MRCGKKLLKGSPLYVMSPWICEAPMDALSHALSLLALGCCQQWKSEQLLKRYEITSRGQLACMSVKNG